MPTLIKQTMSVETVCKFRALAVFHDRLKVFSS
jgi:hypothetical protein